MKNIFRGISFVIIAFVLATSTIGIYKIEEKAFAQSSNNTSADNIVASNSSAIGSDISLASNNTLNNITTFTASGFLRSIVTPLEDPDTPYIIFGYWNSSIDNEDLTNFMANFTMSRVNGSQMHSHQITNFKPANSVFLNNQLGGITLIFSGTSDVYTNNQPKWNNVDTSVIIDNFNTIHIAVDSKGTGNHFNGQPLNGIVESVKDPNDRELLVLVLDPEPIVVPVFPENATAAQAQGTAPATVDTTDTTTSAGGQTSNQGILTNIGEAIQDFFSMGSNR